MKDDHVAALEKLKKENAYLREKENLDKGSAIEDLKLQMTSKRLWNG